MYGLVKNVHLSHSHLCRAFQTETVVYGYYPVAVVGQLPEPGVVAFVISGCSDESSAEHEYDCRLFLSFECGPAVLSRIIYVQEKVAGVPLCKHVCPVRSQKTVVHSL